MKREILLPESDRLVRAEEEGKKLSRERKKQFKSENSILAFEIAIRLGAFLTISYVVFLIMKKVFW